MTAVPIRSLAAVWFAASAGCVAAAGCVAQPAEPGPALLEAVEWYTGAAGTVNDERARELLEEAVAGGGALATMWLARVHSTGRMGFPRDEEGARRLAGSVIRDVQRAAESGVLEAVFLMGTAYDEGLGRPVDAERAAAWHRRAAKRGHVLGAHVLGNQYSEGRGVAEDAALAVEWWTQAAEAGDAITQLRLGEAYEAGRGVEHGPGSRAGLVREGVARGEPGGAGRGCAAGGRGGVAGRVSVSGPPTRLSCPPPPCLRSGSRGTGRRRTVGRAAFRLSRERPPGRPTPSCRPTRRRRKDPRAPQPM